MGDGMDVKDVEDGLGGCGDVVGGMGWGDG